MTQAGADVSGTWQIPGGVVAHGEHPAATVIREFAANTGLAVRVTGVRAVLADVIRLPDLGAFLHTDRVIYDVELTGGRVREEPDSTTDRVAWTVREELSRLPLMPFTAEALNLPVTPLPEDVTHPVGRRAYPPPDPGRGQRFAAYGLVTDSDDRVLLTLIASRYPGAGRWHLPGGGTDHGEQPAAGLLRELVEETGQLGRVADLLDVSHRHDPAALGPEGRPVDWHVVRAVYRVLVDQPAAVRVTEQSGSTERAAWFRRAEADQLPLTDVAQAALRAWTSRA